MSFFKREVKASHVYANDLSGSVYCVAIDVEPSGLRKLFGAKSEHQTGMVFLGQSCWYTPSLGDPKYGNEFKRAPKWAAEIFSDLLTKWLLHNWGVPIEEREANTFDRMEEDLDDLGMLTEAARKHKFSTGKAEVAHDLLTEDLETSLKRPRVAKELLNAVDRTKD